MAYFMYWHDDHWGQKPAGTPLTRLADVNQARRNRDAMCDGFVEDPQVASDSCDEFPFASSYQNGNMLGLSPSQCAEVFPIWVGAPNYWEFVVSEGYSTSQRCGIGHVTLSHNQSTGGAYGAFIRNNRVLDGDPFWMTW